MDILEKIANIFGYTTHAFIAKSQCIPYIPKNYIAIGIITVVAAIAIIAILIERRMKK